MNFKFYQLYRSLKEVVGLEKAKEIFPEYETLPNKMSDEEKIEMARTLMKRLVETFDEKTRNLIRMKHPCGIPKDFKEKMIVIKKEITDSESRIKLFIEYINGSYLKINDNEYDVTWGIRECVCGMFRNIKTYNTISPTWCLCCNGHNKLLFESLLDQNIESILLTGICAGDKICSFKI